MLYLTGANWLTTLQLGSATEGRGAPAVSKLDIDQIISYAEYQYMNAITQPGELNRMGIQVLTCMNNVLTFALIVKQFDYDFSKIQVRPTSEMSANAIRAPIQLTFSYAFSKTMMDLLASKGICIKATIPHIEEDFAVLPMAYTQVNNQIRFPEPLVTMPSFTPINPVVFGVSAFALQLAFGLLICKPIEDVNDAQLLGETVYFNGDLKQPREVIAVMESEKRPRKNYVLNAKTKFMAPLIHTKDIWYAKLVPNNG